MASLHLSQEIFKLIYPVGSIYLSTSTTNPSTYFGGTWEQVAKECYLLGYNSSHTWFDKPGQSKGSANGPGSWNTGSTTLTIDQMPSHKHQINANWARDKGSAGWGATIANYSTGYIFEPAHLYSEMKETGGGKGHNHFHVSPYYIVVVWKRTA